MLIEPDFHAPSAKGEKLKDDEFQQLLCGINDQCDFKFPSTPPVWLDPCLFEVGIDYYHRNMIGIMASNGEALIMGLALPTFYKPLAFSGVTSGNKRAAILRYMDTGKHIYGKWYEGKPWLEESCAAKSLKIVNQMHKRVADMILSAGSDFETKVQSEFLQDHVVGDQANILRDELEKLKQSNTTPEEYYVYVNSGKSFSQFDMTLVQAAFFAAVLVYPEHYGGTNATKKELEGFVHVWRVFGYYMGISENNNAAQYSLARTILVGQEVMEKILKPCLLHVNSQSMIMAQKNFL